MISRNGILTIIYIILNIVIFECINTCNGMSGHDGMHENHTVHDPDSHDRHNNHEMNDTTESHDMDMDMDMDQKKVHANMDHMMYFHAGVKVVILFKEWAVSTAGGIVGSVIGIFLLAVLYEGLKYFREHLFKVYLSSIQFSTVAVTEQNGGSIREVHNISKHKMLSWSHVLQTVLHVIQMIISYFLMLIFMSYNIWLCLAVVLGSGVGYFLFGWKKATVVDVTEHCH